MKNKLILLLFLCSFSFAKEVLLLHSYHKGYTWSNDVSNAIEDRFRDSDVEVTTEYMDTKRIYSDQYLETLFKFYKQRYQNRKFDLIIASDNNALTFLNRYHDKIFTDIPIVFCGINNFNQLEFNKLPIKNRTTGVVEAVDIEKNIDLILKLHPNLSKLFIINDTTPTGDSMKKEFYKIASKYENINIEYVDRFKIDELQNDVKQLDKNSVILFMLLFKDETGKIFTFKDGLEAIEKSSSVPIYGLWDFYVDYGLVGGFLTHGYTQGEYAANMARSILDGKDIKNIAINKRSPNRYIFNHKKLEEFNINQNDLPIYSIIKNKPLDFFETYKLEITLVVLLFLIFLVIIILLFVSLIQKRKTKNQFRLQLMFIETLLNTIRNPIFYKDKDGKYIGCNEAFCEFIGKPKHEIIGKTMHDFFEHQKEFIKVHDEIEEKVLKNEIVGDYDTEYTMPNGEVKNMLVNKTIYHGLTNEVQGIVTVLHDITDFVNIEKEKKQHESFLAQQSKLAEIGEMISAIAHQWNEPLVEMSAIVQDLELQHKTSKLSDEYIQSVVNDSMVQIQYMSKTLKNFRDFLKPSVKKSHFSIKDALDEVLNVLERQIKYSYIDLSIDYKCENLIVYGYKNEFMQVLITIINNAKDAILKLKKDDPLYNGTIKIDVASENTISKIIISDNGCGVRDEDKQKVFDPYYSTKSKGNGLGLYMSRVLIVDKMDGMIYFEDNDGMTSLVIELPKDKG